MKLCLSRSQKPGGMTGSTVIFCLHARAELTPEETDNVKKYKLGRQVIYNSAASRRHLDRVEENLQAGSMTRSLFKGLASLVKAITALFMSKMALNITIDSLVSGHYIEAKDMNEMVRTEETIIGACETLKGYLARAATFNGEAEIREF